MAKERRDNKKRILQKGEYQKSDGRYMYRYTDNNGNARFVYSWTLTQTDRPPHGKQSDKCLRELEKEIANSLRDNIDLYKANKLTLNKLFDIYIKNKKGIKITTLNNYTLLYEHYIKNAIGNVIITDIKYSYIKSFYISLLEEKRLSIGTVRTIHGVLYQICNLAVRDDYIKKNPTLMIMSELKRVTDIETKKVHALTVEQQVAFMQYVKCDNIYNYMYPFFMFLLGTGCRVSEAISIRWDDCDFEKRIISINHNAQYYYNKANKKVEHHISSPKTKSSIRVIPMLDTVYEILMKEKYTHNNVYIEVDGYTNFVFHTTKNTLYTKSSIDDKIKRIIANYNKQELKQAKTNNREPILLPHFSAHTFRHTFCTRLCENNLNIKVIQEIMGHASIQMTMDVYNEATLEQKQKSLKDFENSINIKYFTKS